MQLVPVLHLQGTSMFTPAPFASTPFPASVTNARRCHSSAEALVATNALRPAFLTSRTPPRHVILVLAITASSLPLFHERPIRPVPYTRQVEWGVASRVMLGKIWWWFVQSGILRRNWRVRRRQTRPDGLMRGNGVEALRLANVIKCSTHSILTMGHSRYGRLFKPRVNLDTKSSLSSLMVLPPFAFVSFSFPSPF